MPSTTIGWRVSWRLAVVALAGGCSYSFGSVWEYPALAVGVFENRTEWRDLEQPLTRRLTREMTRQGIVVDPGARHELRGEIRKVVKPVGVSDPRDIPLASSFALVVRYWVRERETGRTLVEGDISESALFVPARGETLDSAREEAFAEVSRTIVSKLEKGW